MTQFARPGSDVTVSGFTGTPVDSAGNRYQNIDESTASDTDFNYGSNGGGNTYETALSAVTDPVLSTGHIVRVRLAKTSNGTLSGTGNAVTGTVGLYQGATLIATVASVSLTGSWVQTNYTLTGTEADSITDYTDLRIRFTDSSNGGSPGNRRGGAISWAVLEVPDATNRSGSGSLATSASLSSAGKKGGQGAGSLAPTASLAPTGKKAGSGSGTLTLSASIVATGHEGFSGAGSLAVSASLSAAGRKDAASGPTLALVLSGSTAGSKAVGGAGTLTLSTSLVASGSKSEAGSSSLGLAATLSASGAKSTAASGTLALGATLNHAAAKQAMASGMLSLSMNFSASGSGATGSRPIVFWLEYR